MFFGNCQFLVVNYQLSMENSEFNLLMASGDYVDIGGGGGGVFDPDDDFYIDILAVVMQVVKIIARGDFC
jgi:hypothetical protein